VGGQTVLLRAAVRGKTKRWFHIERYLFDCARSLEAPRGDGGPWP
jgi:hypothetical protein